MKRQQDATARQAAKPFELYIHVPFCLRRCGYCDFNTYTAVDLGEGASRGGYASVAIREMRLIRDWQEEHGLVEPALSSVFFGGGTPTVLPAEDLVRMLHAARSLWGLQPDAEITTEANPDTVDERYLAQLAQGGFTRVSFGMQSAVPRVLRILERTHTPANVTAGVAAARRLGLECSVDLIYGAPGESIDEWEQSVQEALSLGVNHISAYALTLEPTTKMGRQVAAGQLAHPDDDDEADKYELADDLFQAAGLQWYEVSNWARPGHESRHNLGYWRNVDWAGIGPGAHSHYNWIELDPVSEISETGGSAGGRSEEGAWRKTGQRGDDGSGEGPQAFRFAGPSPAADCSKVAGESVRVWDIRHPRAWARAVNQERQPWSGGEVIGPRERLEEGVMLGLRIREGLSLEKLERLAGGRLDLRRLAPALHGGLAQARGGRIVPTRRGRLLNDDLIADVLEAVGA
ncbi:radical SAM family heme chaperone HemW [Bifidobacterium actinocoloniiforme]|nr:radical SAM family heme chaperone HemW [Bifidobacterium actinocoloniiforme]